MKATIQVSDSSNVDVSGNTLNSSDPKLGLLEATGVNSLKATENKVSYKTPHSSKSWWKDPKFIIASIIALVLGILQLLK